jgi:predicted heme/steroid binding protein
MQDSKSEFSLEELKKRDGKHGSEVWIAYRGVIYDVSSSELFKGGKHYNHACGSDLTTAMVKAPHLDHVMEKFPVVGVLK